MISAIVLAAGRSRRMGTQKLLLPLRGKPMIAIVVDELLRGRVDRVIVVTSEAGDGVIDALAGRNVCHVTTPRDEMLASVRRGLTALDEDCEGVVLALGDQPDISADVVTRLVHFFQSGARGIVVPTHQGRRGHPLVFASRYRNEILTRFDGIGLRGLLAAHPQDVREIEMGAEGILRDIDTPDDYRRALRDPGQ